MHTFEVYDSVSSCDCVQKDMEDTECWLTRIRAKEAREERQAEQLRVVEERLEWREESADARQGDQEVWALVISERRELMQRYEAARKGQYRSLLPQIVSRVVVSLPRVTISPVYLSGLSALYTHWGNETDPQHSVCTGHVLSNHHTLSDGTLLLTILDDGSLSVYMSKGRFLPKLSTPHRVSTLGNIVSRIGTRVSGVSSVLGRDTVMLAALAPFPVGWWSDASNNFMFVLLYKVTADSLSFISGSS